MMKKALYACLLCVTLLSLSSCEAHIKGVSYNVPWYFIAVPVALVLIIAYFATAGAITDIKFVCPKCGAVFNPKRTQLSMLIHADDARLLRCPSCKKMNFCDKSHENY